MDRLLDFWDIVRPLDLLALLDKDSLVEYLEQLVVPELLTQLAVWAEVVALQQQAVMVELVLLVVLAPLEAALVALDILGQLTV